MRWPLLALLLVTPACKKKADTTMVDAEPEVVYPPELKCPDSTSPAGLPPPMGIEVWCSMDLPGGRSQRHGLMLAWHENGQYRVMGEYAYDKKTGTWTHWYPNGKPESEGSWVNGVEQGRFVEFYPSGQKKSEGDMVDGREDGVWTYWSENGNNQTRGSWVLGDRHGSWIESGPSGEMILERTYRNGRLIRQRKYQ